MIHPFMGKAEGRGVLDPLALETGSFPSYWDILIASCLVLALLPAGFAVKPFLKMGRMTAISIRNK